MASFSWKKWKIVQGKGFEPLEYLNKVVSQSDNNIKKNIFLRTCSNATDL